ncbi:type II secretion system protein GspD [Chimaeribacter coloradensis]|uniref:Type II secretion system protein GspD n=1 Tax=Chimaeribacter coloradensis TaxID=2060068 RepID=A0A2N5DUE6_9GAMM|nr:type II secretion system protein GspD [Chimaeribacter coloradensis]
MRKSKPFILTLMMLATLTAPKSYAEQFSANFKNADIKEFVDVVSKNMNKTILVDPSVNGTISVRSYNSFNDEEYYQFFLSVLDLYGFSVVTLDNGLLKVVRSATLKTSPGHLTDDVRPGKGDEVITRVIALQHVPARELAPLLRQMSDSNGVGNVVNYDPSNVLMLTGKASLINRLVEVIKRVDVIGQQHQQLIKLKFASATELAEVLNALTREESKGQSSNMLMPKIVADKRTNTLLISGSEKVRQRITSLVAKLDQDSAEQGNTRVFYLNYAKADKLVEVLTGISEKIAKEKEGEAPSGGASAGNSAMSITADEQTNSLVITAQPDVMQPLADVIAKLDIRRAQVLVEAIIVEVQDGKGLNLGVQWANSNVGGTQFTNTGVPIFSLANAQKNGVTSDELPAALTNYSGFVAGFFEGDWSALLTALSTNSKNDILATPSIVTLDNKEASVNVGQDVPVLSGSQTTSGDNVFNTVERKTIGTKLKVTPQINEGDAVLLEIEQEVSSVDSAGGQSSSLGPTFNTRTIQNAVLVRTGETVVLGGLLDDTSKETHSKVPLLGDIPLVGNLFRYTSTETAKRNLMVFIRPTILRDDDVYHSVSKKKYTNFQKVQKERREQDGKTLIAPSSRPQLDELPPEPLPAAPAALSPVPAPSPAPVNGPRNPFHG